MNADGSNQTRLTNDAAVDRFPRWSADGRILFISNRDGQADIYTMDQAGGNITRLTTVGARQGAWSPDGKKISFVSRSPEIINKAYWLQVFVMDSEDGTVRMITRSPNSTFQPSWSPDGAAIAFVAEYYGNRANIFQIDVQGGTPKRLTAGPKFDGRPAYSADGTKLAFESNRDGNYEIYVMNLR